MKIMKKKSLIIALAALMAFGATAANLMTTATDTPVAAGEETKKAEIKFDTLKVNLGTFSEKDGPQKCSFAFTNAGTAPLVINQAFASCGCTVPTYTKDPVQPGGKGVIDVTYDGRGKFPGHFTKTITIRSNAKNEIVRLSIEGDMTK